MRNVYAYGLFRVLIRSIVVNGAGQHYRQHEGLCYVQALMLQYFYLASYLWTACFAFDLYQIVVKLYVGWLDN